MGWKRDSWKGECKMAKEEDRLTYYDELDDDARTSMLTTL